MKQFYLILLLLLPALLTSCTTYNSEDINQQRIRTEYALSYDADENETEVSATFKYENAYLELNDPAYITFENTSLKKTKVLGATFYKRNFAGAASGSFQYVDQDGNEYNNFASMIEPVEILEVALSSSQGGEVSWKAPALRNEEKMVLLIDAGSETFTASTTAINATSITLRGGEIPSNMTGVVEIFLTRERTFDLYEGTEEGGNISVEYKSKALQTIVEE